MSRRTATRSKPEVSCPNCGVKVVWDANNRWRPFCSERCQLVDLGEWINEEKAIPGEPAEVPPNDDPQSGDFEQ